MTTIVAQHSPAVTAPEDIVAFDLSRPSFRDILGHPDPGYTLQYPVVGAGLLGWYRLPAGGNVNLTPEKGTLVIDGVGDCRLSTATWNEGWLFGCRWGASGHATITPRATVVHAARRDGKIIGWWPTTTWGIVETTLAGVTLTPWVEGRTEPACTGTYSAWCQADGVHTSVGGVERTYPPVKGMPFDPVVSPDGARVCWLEIEGLLPFRSSLIVASTTTGVRTVVVPARDYWQTANAHWLDDHTLVSNQMDPNAPVKHWAVITVDVETTSVTTHTGPEHGNFLHPVRLA